MVNVIIPVYKARNTIEDPLRSLLAQTKKMFMVTIVQDCDGEDYSDIIEKYRNLGLKIFLISTDVNGGPGYARNKGIEVSGMCDYIMFLDADDMLYPRAIELLYREAKLKNYDMVASQIQVEEKAGPGAVIDASRNALVWVHGKIYNKRFLDKYNIRFPKGIRYNEDVYFNSVIFFTSDNRAAIDEITCLWRNNGESLTRKNMEEGRFTYTSLPDYPSVMVNIPKKLTELGVKLYKKIILFCLASSYNNTMCALGVEIENYPIGLFRELWNYAEVREWYERGNFKEIIPLIQPGGNVGKTYYWNKMNFVEWFERYVKGVE